MTRSIESVTSRMEDATGRLLDSLRPEQRETIVLPLDPAAVSEWSYTPLRHEGLLLFEMDAEQRQNVRRLLASCLSEGGYNRAMTTMGSEGILDRIDKFPERRLALTMDGAGAVEDSRRRDPLNFTVAVFNAPGDRAGWGGESAAPTSAYTLRFATEGYRRRRSFLAHRRPIFRCQGTASSARSRRKRMRPGSCCAG